MNQEYTFLWLFHSVKNPEKHPEKQHTQPMHKITLHKQQPYDGPGSEPNPTQTPRIHVRGYGPWLLCAPVFGHWCDKALVAWITALGHSRGESPGCGSMCLCASPQRGKNERHWAPCRRASALHSLPRPPSPSVLPRTLTYSRSRFCDTKIKAFLCFSVSLLSSSPCVTRALSAGALAQDIESAFKLTQSLFTSALW